VWPFMEPEISFPYSQKPAIGPYLIADDPSPHPVSAGLILTYSHLHLALSNGSFSSGFPIRSFRRPFFFKFSDQVFQMTHFHQVFRSSISSGPLSSSFPIRFLK
jgi:hypothetical protein